MRSILLDQLRKVADSEIAPRTIEGLRLDLDGEQTIALDARENSPRPDAALAKRKLVPLASLPEVPVEGQDRFFRARRLEVSNAELDWRIP